MTATLCQNLRAPNDRNGNPQRVWVLYSADGRIVNVIDEGYAGKPEECKTLVELPQVVVRVSEYMTFLLYGRTLS